VMIGTSDIRIEHPDESVITEEEVNYFFEMVGRVFPKIKLDRSQIVYTFSGVRPLQHTEGGATGQISRDHVVKVNEAGDLLDVPVLSLVGGKWTSFRAFSEIAADKVLSRLEIPRKVSTANLKIGGSRGYPTNPDEKAGFFKKLLESYTIEEDRLEELFKTYGTKVEDILNQVGEEASEMLKTIPEISAGEIKYILSTEDVVHLDDLILRRTMLGKLGKITPDGLKEIAQVCAGVLGWTGGETQQEIDRFSALLRHQHKMNFNSFIGG